MRVLTPMILLGALLSGSAAYAQGGGAAPVAAPAAEEEPAGETEAATQPEAAPAADEAELSPEELDALDNPDAVQPDPDAEALDAEAAERLEAIVGEAEASAPPVPEVDDSAAQGWSYYDGQAAGEADAKLAPGYLRHGLIGLGAGLACSGCGCIGATGAELLVAPGVPQGAWQGNDTSYQRGYIDGYRKTTQRRRALYAVAGGTLGSAVAFGTGFAYGIYTGRIPFVNF